jgi:hypothetical protein
MELDHRGMVFGAAQEPKQRHALPRGTKTLLRQLAGQRWIASARTRHATAESYHPVGRAASIP